MRRIILIMTMGLLVAAPGSASAACSPPADISQALRLASTVFVGEVAAVSDDGHTASMRVVSIWKGRDLPGRVEVHGADATEENAAQFVAGATYLVIPENGRAPFLASTCSATQPYQATGTSIPPAYQDAVGATTGRGPLGSSAAADAAESQALETAALGIVSAGVIATGLLMMRLRRPTTRTAMADSSPQPAGRLAPMSPKRGPSARRRMRRIKRTTKRL